MLVLIVKRRYINEGRNDLGGFGLERLCDVTFELSNEDRLRILRELEGEAAMSPASPTGWGSRTRR